MKQKQSLDEMAESLRSTVRHEAPKLASELFGTAPAGMEKLSKPQHDAYIRANWQDPAFRQTLLGRVAPPQANGFPNAEGAKAFVEMVHSAFTGDADAS